jgi:hypothetical protein
MVFLRDTGLRVSLPKQEMFRLAQHDKWGSHFRRGVPGS